MNLQHPFTKQLPQHRSESVESADARCNPQLIFLTEKAIVECEIFP
jgi:hypothetical protein